MNTHADKTQENKSQSVVDGVFQKQSGGESASRFVDNRLETIAQRKLQELANNSNQVKHLKAFQEMANNSPQAIQKKENKTGLSEYLKTRKVMNNGSANQLLPIGASGVVQLKRPTTKQIEEIPELKDRISIASNYYRARKKDIIEIVDSEYGWDMEDVKEVFFDEYEIFFRKLPMIPDRAKESQASFKRLLRQLALWDDKLKEKLDEKVVELSNMRNARKGEDEESTENERDSLDHVTPADERYFQWYLKQSRPAKQVYRGDGRGVNAGFLVGFKFESILPGGTPDISFFGVLQHTHSSVNKNGMVSTTSDRNQAYHWAIDDHNHGVVYEMQVTNYIDVGELLAARNFKNRFAAQLEILIPGKIMAAEVRAVVLYSKAAEVDRKDNA